MVSEEEELEGLRYGQMLWIKGRWQRVPIPYANSGEKENGHDNNARLKRWVGVARRSRRPARPRKQE